MTTQFNPATDKLIISCDGGGIRGLIVALLLQQLNTEFPDFLGQTYLRAGTSTGGIISLAMACGVDLSCIVSLYQNDGGQIFTASDCLGSNGVAEAARARRRCIFLRISTRLMATVPTVVCSPTILARLRSPV